MCHFHEFDEMPTQNALMKSASLEYLKEINPFIYRFNNMKWEIPQLNLEAPQGTSVFQTYFEYKYSNHISLII